MNTNPRYMVAVDTEESPPIRLTLGNVIFEAWPDKHHCRTVFPDGSMLTASPTGLDRDGKPDQEYVQRAVDMGYVEVLHTLFFRPPLWPYGDEPTMLGREVAWAMCVEHEILHTWLAQRGGLAFCPVLWDAANGTEMYEERTKFHHEIEEQVLSLQVQVNQARQLFPTVISSLVVEQARGFITVFRAVLAHELETRLSRQ